MRLPGAYTTAASSEPETVHFSPKSNIYVRRTLGPAERCSLRQVVEEKSLKHQVWLTVQDAMPSGGQPELPPKKHHPINTNPT